MENFSTLSGKTFLHGGKVAQRLGKGLLGGIWIYRLYLKQHTEIYAEKENEKKLEEC